MMERPILRLTLILALCLTAVLLLTDGLPLGVPGEWTWERVDLSVDRAAGAFLAAVAGAVYAGFVLLGRRRMSAANRLERCGWLLGLLAFAFGWLWVALDSSPLPLGYSRVPWVLYYPRSSGYFWQARYEVEGAAAFLAGYEDLLAERDYLHIGTHPPGLTLGYLGLLELCQSSPAVRDAVLATQPSELRSSLDVLQTSPVATTQTVGATDAACLWLAALLTQLAAVLTTLGIYGLAARHHDRPVAWTAASLWPLVPAIAVFFPKSDVLFPLLAVMAAWLWLRACDRQSLPRALAAGLVLWTGMLLSLAFVTVFALIAVMTGWEAWGRRAAADRSSPQPFLTVKLATMAAAGLLVPTVLLGILAHVNLLNVWLWNLSNHALFYEHNVRTWWAWLLVNPLELSLGAGLPIVLIALAGTWRLVSSGRWQTSRASDLVAFALVWGLLWLSGKNMGEAARLWILIMPWVALISAHGLDEPPDAATNLRRRGDIGFWLIVAQLLVAIVTISRVDGFQFGELLAS